MRIAVISDIHANLEALEAVMRRIEEERVDEVVCLGDTVGYGPQPNECLDIVRSSCATVILGNHDEWVVRRPDHAAVPEAVWQSIAWTAEEVRDDHKAFIAGLPLIAHTAERLYVHASPSNPGSWEYITDEASAAKYFSAIGRAECYVGHSHMPGIYRLRAPVDVGDHVGCILNVGSVGQPRDGSPEATFVITDDRDAGERRHRIMRVPYNTESTAKKILDRGLPEFFAYRLGRGR